MIEQAEMQETVTVSDETSHDPKLCVWCKQGYVFSPRHVWSKDYFAVAMEQSRVLDSTGTPRQCGGPHAVLLPPARPIVQRPIRPTVHPPARSIVHYPIRPTVHHPVRAAVHPPIIKHQGSRPTVHPPMVTFLSLVLRRMRVLGPYNPAAQFWGLYLHELSKRYYAVSPVGEVCAPFDHSLQGTLQFIKGRLSSSRSTS